ncbi:HD/PDEase domain [Moorella glycerini]|uniref:Cyclic di-GMP phosphodiesterase response regulator RpfG n=1 Tax=Neomoorella stamsii TaxID=1266720 RepID=A0A9X7J6A4_9FIRM|nr:MULTISPECIES: HD-GYP domain-containing protein [Moorella]PRR77860.1 Cyclic di-GMP phosphodiesterase response regulator RpfG [Moorella stamsii]CEP68969.1 HD/PDEase domain [Moorella glycerini]
MDGNSPRPLGAGLDTYHFQPATSQPLGSYHQPLPIEKPVGMTGVPDGPVGEIYQEAQEALSDVYHRCRLGSQLEVKNIQEIVADFLNRMQDNQDMFLQMAMLKDLDPYSSRHSLNVTVLATLLGSKLGLSQDELLVIGVGAMLHDVGKLEVPPAVLLKPGKLTAEEFAVIKRHPQAGYERLDGVVSEAVRRVARDHHERCNGSGYPKGLNREELSLAARCVAIADVYDAVTTDRCYRPRYLPHEGMELLMVESTMGNLDLELVRVFLQAIASYPVGTTVRLTTGEIARVIAQEPEVPMRPVVKVLQPRRRAGEIIRLLTNPSILIVEAEP